MPKFNKLQRGVCLSLFLISSVSSYFNPHMLYIAGFSIFGVVSFDIICFLKDKSTVKDYSSDIEVLKSSCSLLAGQLQDIKNDASIGKLASTFQRKQS